MKTVRAPVPPPRPWTIRDLVGELRSMAMALPAHSPDCSGRSVAGAACCYFAERHKNARALLDRVEPPR